MDKEIGTNIQSFCLVVLWWDIIAALFTVIRTLWQPVDIIVWKIEATIALSFVIVAFVVEFFMPAKKIKE